MTGELVPLFQGSVYQVRAKEFNDDTWFPLIDLSEAWLLDRTTLFKHIERHPELFDGCTLLVDFLSKDGTETVRCVNEEGLYLLIARINLGKLKDPHAKTAIQKFRQSAPKLIKAYRKKEISSPQPLIQEELDRAKLLAEATGGKLQEFQKIALKICGFGEYAPALDTPPVQHGDTGWYNVTRLIGLCNDPDLTPERLNFYLRNKGYQYKDGYLWRLTPEGAVHGREYTYEAPSGHREIRIAWRESILYASGLKRQVAETQLALPIRA